MVLPHALDSLVEGQPGVVGYCAQACERSYQCEVSHSDETVHVKRHIVVVKCTSM